MNLFETVFTQPIFNILLFLYGIIPGHDLGIAVIVFTIMVRFALWPLVKRQLHQSKVMRDIQPQLAVIKKKAKGNRQVEGQLMMELYKEKGVNPFSSFGLLLVQLPFFIALYSSINIVANHRDQIAHYMYPFLSSIPHLKEVAANPKQFNELSLGVIDMTKSITTTHNWTVVVLVIIALVTAAVQFVQSKQLLPQPKEKKRLRDIFREQANGKNVDQSEVMAAVSSRTILLMPIVIFFASVSVAAALSFYLLTTTVVGYLQQRRVLGQDTDEMETTTDAIVASEAKKSKELKDRSKQAKPAKIVASKRKKR